MKRAMKAASWIGCTVGEWALLYYALLRHTGWAWNVFVFLTWLMTVLVIIAAVLKLISDTLAPDKAKTIEHSVPLWLAATSDMLVALVLAGSGHWFYGTMVVFQMWAEQYTHSYTRTRMERGIAQEGE